MDGDCMSTDKEVILEQAGILYDVKLDHEITMGGTSSLVFEVERGQTAYILRASEYSPDKNDHIAFELKWMEYLSNHLAGVVRPQKSIKGNLYEITVAARIICHICLELFVTTHTDEYA